MRAAKHNNEEQRVLLLFHRCCPTRRLCMRPGLAAVATLLAAKTTAELSCMYARTHA
jgi:hypothetical protein